MEVLGLAFLTSSPKSGLLGSRSGWFINWSGGYMVMWSVCRRWFVQGDCSPAMLKESDVVISDLPVGYYPDDAIVSLAIKFLVKSIPMPTHLLMEQGLKYLKSDSYGYFSSSEWFIDQSSKWLIKMVAQRRSESGHIIALARDIFQLQSR